MWRGGCRDQIEPCRPGREKETSKMKDEANKETKTTSRPQWQDGDDRITAEIGKVYLHLVREHGLCSIELVCGGVAGTIIDLADYCQDNHGVDIEPERIITDCDCESVTVVEPDVLDAVRRWCANNGIQFTREVDDSELFDDEDA